MSMRWLRPCTLLTIGLTLAASPAFAQYFGQNKVRYESFDFQVLKTEHFDIYYYSEEKPAVTEAARMAERWYDRLSKVLDHQLSKRQPLILYASHPHFEQTNVLQGDIGEGTGGVTEAAKRRIVLPLAASLAETDHVIGHELVHAFQFDLSGRGNGIGLGGGGAGIQLPLWFVEGMAEYLTLGHVDPHTALWMRDAALANKLPSYGRLDDPRYFPYRFGQAWWAYVAGRWGEPMVGRLYRAAVRGNDPARAIQSTLGTSADSLVRDWHQSIRDWAMPTIQQTSVASKAGRALVVATRAGGRLNVAPSLSPDGSRVMFLSERGLFSIEMYMADAKTGKILKQVTKTVIDPHFQSLQFIGSSGAWSPDGKRFAFAAVSRGQPILSVLDVASGHVDREATFPKLGEIFHPTWSPDGRKLAFSAIQGGLTDLWVYDLDTKAARRLTDDRWADLEPAWSPDGRSIAFVTDRFGENGENAPGDVPQDVRLALVAPDGGEIRPLRGFARGKHVNPQWTPDGRSLVFVADPNGIPNLYRMSVDGGEPTQLTNLSTGVSGITRLSPAVSVARNAGTVAFSAYEKSNYEIYVMDTPATQLAATPSPTFGNDPAALPPATRTTTAGDVPEGLPALARVDTVSFRRTPYRAGLSLDYVSQPSLGVATGTNGLAVGGGASLYWSDMLGNHNLATLLQFNNVGGDVSNSIAAGIGYLNQKSRWNWGAEVTQIPYIAVDFVEGTGTYQGESVIIDEQTRYWQIERTAEANLAYPFSRFQRIEFSGGVRAIDFKSEVETQIFRPSTGEQLADETTDLPAPGSLTLGTAGGALVYDSAIFGGTSPALGQRYRFGLNSVFGSLTYEEILGDFRRYVMPKRPLILAGRVLHYGRYGSDSEDPILSDLFLGYPTLIRGYDDGSFSADECEGGDGVGTCPVFDQLIGTKLAVANLELRLPLFGALGLVPSPAVPPIEAAVFFDAGTAWRDTEKAEFLGGTRKPVTSHGVALRVNLLGFAVGEIDYVHPNDRPMKGWYWQFALQPGF